MLQPMIINERFGIWVKIKVGVEVIVDVAMDVDVIVIVDVGVRASVGVIEGIVPRVGDRTRVVAVDVADGMNGGVGERIDGCGDGETASVVTGREIFHAPHADRTSVNTITGNIFIMLVLQSRLLYRIFK